ncbi:hypothetical protein VT84_20780 [Gemmata sp. SH-PL17]|uniref:DUF2934 domain-containing protein n=1 Tax=Gemmata sp. SH-PL17 TaxID=1630693 RepID=UPI00078EAE63|nr:DUF2934 domain-containing protein [Gemmata sp. SH-PL17]AMV26848.1 hypothetical protein VT84_20780 [Gemmata sp. SH-PL17]
MANKPSSPAQNNRTQVSQRTNPAAASESVSLQPASHPAKVSTDKIRARAFFLWEQAGQPEGDGVEFWLRAEQELAAPR